MRYEVPDVRKRTFTRMQEGQEVLLQLLSIKSNEEKK
ncbi:hypothetical protein [Citrobacter phage vB_CfrS_K1M]